VSAPARRGEGPSDASHAYRLLTTLIRHAGKVLTHQQLLKEVWGRPGTDQPHYLHVFMAPGGRSSSIPRGRAIS